MKIFDRVHTKGFWLSSDITVVRPCFFCNFLFVYLRLFTFLAKAHSLSARLFENQLLWQPTNSTKPPINQIDSVQSSWKYKRNVLTYLFNNSTYYYNTKILLSTFMTIFNALSSKKSANSAISEVILTKKTSIISWTIGYDFLLYY